MDSRKFMRGIGWGLAAGVSLGMCIAPMMTKKKCRNGFGRALRAAGDLADNIFDVISR